MKLVICISLLLVLCLFLNAKERNGKTMHSLPSLLGKFPLEKKVNNGAVIHKANASEWNQLFSFFVSASSVNGLITSVSFQMIRVKPEGRFESLSAVNLIIGSYPLWTPSLFAPGKGPEMYVPINVTEKSESWHIDSIRIPPNVAHKAYIQLVCKSNVYAIALRDWMPSSGETKKVPAKKMGTYNQSLF